jgi:uncharacterized protein YegP (UPF0339 family)
MAKKSKPKVKFQINHAVNDEFFVRIVLGNGKQTFTSGETYQRRQGCQRAIKGLVDALHELDYQIVDESK